MDSLPTSIVTFTIASIIAYGIYKKLRNTDLFKNKTEYGSNRLMQLNNSNKINITLPLKLALVTDLDRTLVNHDSECKCDDKNVKRFNDLWCNKYASNNCVLIYATGRSIKEYKKLIKECNILKPDILISHDGSSIHWFNKSLTRQVQAKSTHKIDLSFDETINTTKFVCYDELWETILCQGWNKDHAAQIHKEIHDKFTLSSLKSESLEPFRVGVSCKDEDLAKEVRQYYMKRVDEFNKINSKENKNKMEVHTFTCIGKKVELNKHEYWSTMSPKNAGKGAAVEFVRKRLGLNKKDIICMGDSGNDMSMLGIDGYNSVIMANASSALLRFYDENNKDRNMIKTTQKSTLGVIEGLQHYGAQLLKH